MRGCKQAFIDDILVFSGLCFRFPLYTACKVVCTLFSPIISISTPFSFAQWNSGCLSVSSKYYLTVRNHLVLKDCWLLLEVGIVILAGTNLHIQVVSQVLSRVFPLRIGVLGVIIIAYKPYPGLRFSWYYRSLKYPFTNKLKSHHLS